MKTIIRFGVWITVLTAAACDSQEQRDVDEDVMACSAGRCDTNDSRTPAGGIVSTEGRVNQGGQQDEPARPKTPVAGMRSRPPAHFKTISEVSPHHLWMTKRLQEMHRQLDRPTLLKI